MNAATFMRTLRTDVWLLEALVIGVPIACLGVGAAVCFWVMSGRCA